MMTNQELARQRRQIQRRIREVLTQRRIAAPVVVPAEPPPDGER